MLRFTMLFLILAQLPAPLSAQSLSPQKLIREYRFYNGLCRGATEVSNDTWRACGARDYAAYILEQLDWCFGKEDEFSYQMRWHRCEADSNRGVLPMSLQPFVGTFYPAGDPDWPCEEDGAILGYNLLAIMDGKLYGMENTCRLSNAQPSAKGVRFDALCSGEGMVEREDLTLSEIPGGVAITRNGYRIEWLNCNSR